MIRPTLEFNNIVVGMSHSLKSILLVWFFSYIAIISWLVMIVTFIPTLGYSGEAFDKLMTILVEKLDFITIEDFK